MKKVLNTTVIIRTAGERTVEACRFLLEQQVPKSHIHILRDKPFAKAVRRTFEIGIAQGRKWTLAVDADILVKRNGVKELITNAENLNKKLLQKLYVYQGNVLCKVFGKPRQAGFHLYQTDFLEKAFQHIPKDDFVIRPESGTYEPMVKQEYIHYIDDKIYALHDYEQYYRDMFRNGYFQTRKHFYRVEYLMNLWKERVKEDLDYKALLYGWTYGLVNQEKLKVDLDYFDKVVQTEFPKLGLREKSEMAIPNDGSLFDFIEEKINPYRNVPLQTRGFPIPKPPLSKTIRIKLGYAMIRYGQLLRGKEENF